MPERARVIRALFPGERDRGAPADRALGMVQRFMGALVNGNFTQATPVFNTLRQQPLLDTYCALGARLRFIVVHAVEPVRRERWPDDRSERGADEPDQTWTASSRRNEITLTPAPTVRRCGGSASGGSAPTRSSTRRSEPSAASRSRASWSCRRTRTRTSAASRPIPAATLEGVRSGSSAHDQNIGDYFGLAAPSSISGIRTATSQQAPDAGLHAARYRTRPGQDHRRLGVGPLLFISANLKASAIYEHLWRDDYARARLTAGVIPNVFGAEAISSPCNCKRGSEFRSAIPSPTNALRTHRRTHMKLRASVLAALVGLVGRCGCPPFRARRDASPSRVPTRWSSSASAGPRST